MIVCGHSSRMIPVLPESTFSALTAIEFLTRFSSDQLNRFGNRFIPVPVIIDKRVDMIWGDCRIQNAKPEALFGLKQPVHPPLFIICKIQKKFAFMTTAFRVEAEGVAWWVICQMYPGMKCRFALAICTRRKRSFCPGKTQYRPVSWGKIDNYPFISITSRGPTPFYIFF